MAYFDYLYKFPLAGLTDAFGALEGLRSAGILGTDAIPTNMLGDWRDADGNIVTSDPVWIGRQGSATFGDPAYWYIAIRAEIDPATLPFDPTAYGLTVCDPSESASVLGVWA